MSEVFKDVKILVAEGLYEEAERRLIAYLREQPHDEPAIRQLAQVEKQIFLQKQLQVKIPTRDEAYAELETIAEPNQASVVDTKLFLDWIQRAPTNLVTDLTIVLGTNGWIDAWSQRIDGLVEKMDDPAAIVETLGWVGRFFLEQNQPLRARPWLEKAINHLPVPARTSMPGLWKELRLEYSRCLWRSGERNQAILGLQALLKEFPLDREIQWMIENYEREL